MTVPHHHTYLQRCGLSSTFYSSVFLHKNVLKDPNQNVLLSCKSTVDLCRTYSYAYERVRSAFAWHEEGVRLIMLTNDKSITRPALILFEYLLNYYYFFATENGWSAKGSDVFRAP